MKSPAIYNATIIRRKDIHEALWVIWVAPDSGRVTEFKPGQFFPIGKIDEAAAAGPAWGTASSTSDLIQRSYSIVSSPNETEALEIVVVRVDDGDFSPWLYAQQPGARLWLGPKPGGGFTLDGVPDKDADKDIVLVSTGTGIAPYISMLRTYKDAPRWRRLVIINGVRHERDLTYREELEAAARREDIFYVPVVSRDPADSGWEGLRGRVQSALEPDVYEGVVGAPLSPDTCHVFLCGNPDMIDDAERMMKARGFKRHLARYPGNLHLERYW